MQVVIEGATGDDNLGPLCLSAKSTGKPYYAHNKSNTYVRMDVSTSQLTFEYRDVEGKSLYKVEVKK